jgi:hypothetical protein
MLHSVSINSYVIMIHLVVSLCRLVAVPAYMHMVLYEIYVIISLFVIIIMIGLYIINDK